MDGEEAPAGETASNTGLIKILLLGFFPGLLIVAFSLESFWNVIETIQILIEVAMSGLYWMSRHVLKGILYFIPTPIECFALFLVRKVCFVLITVSWSCRVVYYLIELVAAKHQRGDIVWRLEGYLEAWLVEFKAELRRGNVSNPVIVAAQRVYLLPRTPPTSHQQ